jgi:toxin CcdB
MPRFDVYEAPGRFGYLLDVQADILHELNTRVVIPLVPADDVPISEPRLYPRFDVHGSKVLMATHFMAAVPRKQLRIRVSSLQRHAASVLGAIDFLHQGW